MAAAARLSKLGHRVTLCERTGVLGGAIRTIQQGGFRWDAGPTSTLLPAVLRDLFRKSGRPIERYVDLRLRVPARRHVFADSSYVDLPTGSRAAQADALDAGLGAGTGQAWTQFVDGQAAVWDTLRRRVLDEPDGGARLGERDVARALSARVTLAALLRRSFADERLRQVAGYQITLAGSRLDDVPAFAGVAAYVERSFGVWCCPDGMADLVRALGERLRERGVEVIRRFDVGAIVSRDGQVAGVRSAEGQEIRADHVVTDIDVRVVFGRLVTDPAIEPARRIFRPAKPAVPPDVTHLGLAGSVPELPDEVVLHGDPLLAVRTSGRAGDGRRAWTVLRRGESGSDVLAVLAARGIDVRDHVLTRVDRSAADLIAECGGSPYGLAWAGYRTLAARSRFTAPMPGLHCLGASMHPGPGIPYVAWGAAHVAARIGSA
jgi:phytoene dehydrogenase-like protein